MLLTGIEKLAFDNAVKFLYELWLPDRDEKASGLGRMFDEDE